MEPLIWKQWLTTQSATTTVSAENKTDKYDNWCICSWEVLTELSCKSENWLAIFDWNCAQGKENLTKSGSSNKFYPRILKLSWKSLPVLKNCIVLHWKYMPLVDLSVNGHLGCFHVFVNRATWTQGHRQCSKILTSMIWRIHIYKNKLARINNRSGFIFWEPLYYFTLLYHFVMVYKMVLISSIIITLTEFLLLLFIWFASKIVNL